MLFTAAGGPVDLGPIWVTWGSQVHIDARGLPAQAIVALREAVRHRRDTPPGERFEVGNLGILRTLLCAELVADQYGGCDGR
jgi:hypothetical protein